MSLNNSASIDAPQANSLSEAVDMLTEVIVPTNTGAILPPEMTQPIDQVTALTEPNLGKQSTGFRVAVLITVITPFLGLAAAIALLWGTAFSWVYLAILGVMYIATGLGITVGYHRLFTHRSFEAGPVVTWIWAVLGSMAVEGPVLKWCATHRMHHQHSDKPDDPHSPHHHGDDIRGFFLGFFHAHMGWLFDADARGLGRYVTDLKADPVVNMVSRQFLLWVTVGLVLPAILGGLLTWSWMGVLLGFLWGGLVRVLLVHHVTWSINSVCHVWGARPFRSHDESRNNTLFGILGFGEGWHNNHHAFPASARHGLAWWQFDSSYVVIRTMEILGLVRRVRVPAPDRIKAKLRA